MDCSVPAATHQAQQAHRRNARQPSKARLGCSPSQRAAGKQWRRWRWPPRSLSNGPARCAWLARAVLAVPRQSSRPRPAHRAQVVAVLCVSLGRVGVKDAARSGASIVRGFWKCVFVVFFCRAQSTRCDEATRRVCAHPFARTLSLIGAFPAHPPIPQTARPALISHANAALGPRNNNAPHSR